MCIIGVKSSVTKLHARPKGTLHLLKFTFEVSRNHRKRISKLIEYMEIIYRRYQTRNYMRCLVKDNFEYMKNYFRYTISHSKM